LVIVQNKNYFFFPKIKELLFKITQQSVIRLLRLLCARSKRRENMTSLTFHTWRWDG